MTLIDTNVILRYLLDDIKEQADKAEKIIKGGAYTLTEIIAEVVYVLSKLYRISRAQTSEIVISFLDEISIQNKEIIIFALQIFAQESFDFVDCLLVARKKILGEIIFTFDKKLIHKLNNV